MRLIFTDAGRADWPHLLCLWWRNVRATHGFVDEGYLRAIGAALVGEYLPAMERVRLAVLLTETAGTRSGHGTGLPLETAAADRDGCPHKGAGTAGRGPLAALPTVPLSMPLSMLPDAPAGGRAAGPALTARDTTGTGEGLPSLIQKREGIRSVPQEPVPRPSRGRLTVGFLGSVGARVEMLFVEPGLRGRGIGTALLDDFRSRHAAVRLDVNEQNTAARAFYARRGFVVTGRSPLDGAGQPYPLLHLSWTADRRGPRP